MKIATNLVRTTATLLLWAASALAHANFISFDERPWRPGPDGDASFFVDPVSTEYQSLGVLFDSAYLRPFDTPLSSPFDTGQSLLGGPFFTVNFIGTLPLYVSLHFTSLNAGTRAMVSAVAGGVSFATASTGGEYWGGDGVGFVQDKPYVPDSFATFHSALGISTLTFSSDASTRNVGWIDSLYFGSVPAIPEPGTMALLAVGLAVIVAWKRLESRP